MKLALRIAILAMTLVICGAVAGTAAAQDPDRCPGVDGPIFGCPDADDDRVQDDLDLCPALGDLSAPDYYRDGCPDAIFGVRYQARIVPRGLRITRLRLVRIAGPRQSRTLPGLYCRARSGKPCWGGFVDLDKRPRDVFPRGTRLVIQVLNEAAFSSVTECHRLTIEQLAPASKASEDRMSLPRSGGGAQTSSGARRRLHNQLGAGPVRVCANIRS